MIYKFFELLLKISVRIYFKNKVITGRDNIPKGKPVLFVANHPGAFLDPIVIGSYADRSLYYIARGESFKNKFSAWFFKKIHMIPVYRKEETPELTHKNEAVFGACYEHFENGRSLMIFPEGTSKIEYRLRKVKSGAARIALGAEAKNNFKLGLTIVPVGITYSNPMNFRTDVQVNFGKPVPIEAYKDRCQEDSFATAKTLTRDIEQSIKDEMLLIENRENDEIFDQLQKLYFEEMINRFEAPNLPDNEKLELKNNLVKAIDYFKSSAPDLSNKLQQLLKEYFAKMTDIESKYPEFNKRLVCGKPSITAHVLGLIAGLPLFLLGTLFNYIPYRISGVLAEKFSQRDDFTGALRLVIGTFSFLITYILWGILFAQFFTIFIIPGLFVLMPLLGMFSLGYNRVFAALRAELFYQKMIVTENYSFKKLLELRENIIEELEEARLLYNKRTINRA
ncbi:MAG: lysophospholipid acyltransferase family protein [Flavobacteriales bacterium]